MKDKQKKILNAPKSKGQHSMPSDLFLLVSWKILDAKIASLKKNFKCLFYLQLLSNFPLQSPQTMEDK